MRKCVWLAMVICISTFAEEPGRIDVRVLTDGRQCVVHDRQMACDAVGPYLRDTLRIAQDHFIGVFVDGTERSQERGKGVSELIRSAGYSRIVRVGFITEPGQGKGYR